MANKSIPETPARIHTGVMKFDHVIRGDGFTRAGGCTSGCGACCEQVILPLDPRITVDKARFEDWKRWADLHGIVVVSDIARGLRAYIPLSCESLNPDQTCRIHDNRPEMCKQYPQRPDDLESVRNVCTYRFDEDKEVPPSTG